MSFTARDLSIYVLSDVLQIPYQFSPHHLAFCYFEYLGCLRVSVSYPRVCRTPCLLPNNIGTPFIPHPNLVNPPRINIKSITNTECLFRGVLVLWVCDGQLAAEDEMCGQASMRMRAVVCVRAICPGEDVIEAPGAHLVLIFPTRLLPGHGRDSSG